MEAPKKIYIYNFGSELSHNWHTNHSCEKDIEYVRKDAFIEEVCNFLQKNCTYTHPRKGTPTCAVNLTLLKEYLEDKV